jgi:2-polyprenyl-6-methoxyphenol hydroxylase-like FAD-dependent oxidoreductase
MRVAVLGGGMMGLCSAMLLAQDRHEVTVFERDPAEPPDPAVAWESWERRGVNQFRLAHFFLSRFRGLVESELPDLAANLTGAGACRYNIITNIPDEMKGGTRPGDDEYDTLTGRRVVVEAVTARTAESTPGVTIRRGAPVAGLLTGAQAGAATPHVTGVKLDSGEAIDFDLVVDATGRRSPLPRWLAELGAAPVEEEGHDSGFVYYGRHFRSDDGSLPFMFGPLKQDYGSIGILTLPADNGTWSVTITASSKDAALRALTDPVKFAAVVKLLPLAAHWADATPIDDGVAAMAKIEDRIRRFAPGGRPVATGVLAVADSWSCTNPTLGRGASIGLTHAVALRDMLRRSASADPLTLAVEWDEVTLETVEPWSRTTERYDRHRLGEMTAIIEDRPYQTDDPAWPMYKTLDGPHGDPELLRATVDIGMTRRRAEEVFVDPDLADRLARAAAAVANSDDPGLGPDRQQLLAAVS